MIGLSDARRATSQTLRSSLQSMGFIRDSDLVFRRRAIAEEFFLVGLRRDDRGFFALTASVALRFPQIADLLEGSASRGLHLNVPIHLLSESRRFEERQFSELEQLPDAIADLTSELSNSGLAFFGTFGTPVQMRDRLRSESPQDWFTLSPEQRTELLAALEAKTGSHEIALALIDAALWQRQGGLPKKRIFLEALRDKIAALASS